MQCNPNTNIISSNMVLATLGIALSSGIRAKRQSFGCSNSGNNDRIRMLFLNAHNEARLSVAMGLEPNKCGSLPSAKNMYRMVRFSNSKPKMQNSPSTPYPSVDMNSTLFSFNGLTVSMNIEDNIATALSTWWGKVRQYGSTDPENKYVDSNLYTFANMVHSKTTGIGCAYKVCDVTKLTITCLYNKIGYYTNGVMWENGTACTSASDCTTYPGSTCEGRLCVKGPEDPDAGANTMCPSNANMTDAARKKFLDTHNYLRSRVAQGLEPDALGGNAPKASKMLKMVYDCDIEASAIKHSQKCVYEHSLPADRVGFGENLFRTSILNADRVESAAQSSQAWWDELKTYGVGQANNLTQELWNRPNMQIGHYSQMAWDRTYKLGCSIQHCPSFTYVVCQYGPQYV
ncbi:unnamed protein product [Haemonchus placei]|uniref:SCP-like protein n=1 Tax=Haemonchus placei TaxID=6290 RepID=A0A0N4W7P1_HAEPC|nr:unnamed protein product [Haemonchus placei]